MEVFIIISSVSSILKRHTNQTTEKINRILCVSESILTMLSYADVNSLAQVPTYGVYVMQSVSEIHAVYQLH